MSLTSTNSNKQLVLVYGADARPETYSLEAAANLAGLHPEMLRHYCRLGLLAKRDSGGETRMMFDEDDIYQLRRFEEYRRNHGVSRKTLRVIFGLWRDIELLQEELRFLRRL